jgi:hypothetical protein
MTRGEDTYDKQPEIIVYIDDIHNARNRTAN